jgi:signal transduction histidine kinase
VDQRLSARLHDASGTRQAVIGGTGVSDTAENRDLDDAPVVFWRVGADGRPASLDTGQPVLPAKVGTSAAYRSVVLGSSPFRVTCRPQAGGTWLVAGQSLAAPNHIRGLLIEAEAVVAPVILIAIYLGSLVIGVQAAAPVERARRRQLEFSADASHELRTPLSVIQAEVELALASPRSTEYYRSSLDRVAGESARLRRIVDDLLWLARFEAEPPPPGDSPVDLVARALACTERFRALADARHVLLDTWADAEMGRALIKAPEEWIDRLFGVLVDNACRYTPPDGSVTVAAGMVGSRSYLLVEDDGPGIPADERDRLFDRFHRATEAPGGVGLGLAIADSIVRSTGGRWRIEGSASGGARLEVSWHRAPERGRHGDEVPIPPGLEVAARPTLHGRQQGGSVVGGRAAPGRRRAVDREVDPVVVDVELHGPDGPGPYQ